MKKLIIVFMVAVVLFTPFIAKEASAVQGIERELNSAMSSMERSLRSSMNQLERSLNNMGRQLERSFRGFSPSFSYNYTPKRFFGVIPFVGFGLAAVWRVMGVVLLGWLLFTLFPSQTETVAVAASGEPLKAIIYGLLGYLAVVPLTITLVITILGIPLVPVLWIAVAAARLFGQVALGLLVGRALSKSLGRDMLPAHHVLLGLLALGLAISVPGVGGLISLFCSLLGFGAVIWTRAGRTQISY